MASVLQRKVTRRLLKRIRDKGACLNEVNIIEAKHLGTTIGKALQSDDSRWGEWIQWVVVNKLFRKSDTLELLSMIKVKVAEFTVDKGWLAQDDDGRIYWYEEKPTYDDGLWWSPGSFFKDLGEGRPNPEAEKYLCAVDGKVRVNLLSFDDC